MNRRKFCINNIWFFDRGSSADSEEDEQTARSQKKLTRKWNIQLYTYITWNKLCEQAIGITVVVYIQLLSYCIIQFPPSSRTRAVPLYDEWWATWPTRTQDFLLYSLSPQLYKIDDLSITNIFKDRESQNRAKKFLVRAYHCIRNEYAQTHFKATFIVGKFFNR